MTYKKYLPQFIKDRYKHFISEYYIISYPKAGRTWLRFLIGYYLNNKYDLGLPLKDITTTRVFYDYGLPYINFCHFGEPHLIKNNYVKKINLKSLKNKKIVFLYRDPRPQSVSNYYQFFHRGDKKKLKNLKIDDNIDSFILGNIGGIKSIIDYYNLFLEFSIKYNVFFLKYENMLVHSEKEIKSLFSFLNFPEDKILLNQTLVAGSKKNLSTLEQKNLLNSYHFGGTSNINYKVRKNKLKWNEEIKPETLNIVNKLVKSELNPFFL